MPRRKSHIGVLPGSPRHFRVEFEYDAIDALDELGKYPMLTPSWRETMVAEHT